MPTNPNNKGSENLHPDSSRPTPSRDRNQENPGYETQDVNVGGMITFLAGLSGFLAIFFIFCWVMGKAINTGLRHTDGERDKWHEAQTVTNNSLGRASQGNLTSNTVLEQQEYAAMTKRFPTPRLQTDDGNQDTADLHAREDLLLDYYSSGSGLPAGRIRIPIDRAMQLVVQKGLPQPAGGLQTVGTTMAGDSHPTLSEPLTDGFARTGYELDQISAREQRTEFNQAQAEAKP